MCKKSVKMIISEGKKNRRQRLLGLVLLSYFLFSAEDTFIEKFNIMVKDLYPIDFKLQRGGK